MDRLEALRLFVRIVETNSFTRAADGLDVPRATATHAVKQLEASLNTRLLERTTRQVRPTLDGQAFYERCVHVLAELDEAESALRHVASNPSGILRVDMQGTHATRIVLPHIDAFHARYPNIELIVSSGDRLVDLVREGIDCVVRAGTPRDSNLVARRLADIPQIVCASPDYLSRHGVPSDPSDLAAHHIVRFAANSGASDYPLELMIDGQLRVFRLNGWISVSDAEHYVTAALRGCGLIQLPRFHVEDELRAGHLVEVLAEWQSPALRIAAMYHYRRQLSARVRVFVDWLAELYEQRFGPG
jgi:DNA-binding transcriptional LysR family regulator